MAASQPHIRLSPTPALTYGPLLPARAGDVVVHTTSCMPSPRLLPPPHLLHVPALKVMSWCARHQLHSRPFVPPSPLQVMSWCARHQLHSRPHTGRYSSVPDWMRQLHQRRHTSRPQQQQQQAPGSCGLFLDDMLQVGVCG